MEFSIVSAFKLSKVALPSVSSYRGMEGEVSMGWEEGKQRGCCLLFSCRVCLTANRINETPGIDAINYFAVEAENYIMKRLKKKKKSPQLFDTVLSKKDPTAQI